MSDAIASSIYGGDTSRPAEDNQSTPIVRIFNRAVVIQTLCDPSTRDTAPTASLLKTLVNKADYARAPRNSIVCRIVTDGRGKTQNSDFVCFPFFSSHLMMPVKAGEQVWIFFEQVGALEGRPYWVSRIAEPLLVEDANFTHSDRRLQRDFQGTATDSQKEDGSGNFVNPRKLTFQNANPAVPDNATLFGGQEVFPSIITGSAEYGMTAIEPVPRLTKRPGDLVIQGSNNTAIYLGTAMGWDVITRPLEATPSSKATPPPTPPPPSLAGTAAIDIVTGRGRYFRAPGAERDAGKQKKIDGKIPEAKSTRPHIEENVLNGKFETDKNAATQQIEAKSKEKGNTKTNPQEGDPDFLMDASRVFLGSSVAIDVAFGTGPTGVAKSFENPIVDKKGAAVAIKSDHIRIVARKSQLQKNSDKEPADIASEDPLANGSIRIIKEGEPNADLASIVMEQDGVIQISGSKIFLGRKTDDGGAGTGPGPGESQPYVKYHQLEELLTKTFDDLTKFVQDLQANFVSNSTPGFGGPNPALIKSAAKECTALLAAIKTRKSEIIKLKSERIFGE